MSGIERKWLKNWNDERSSKWKRPVSILLTLLFVIALIAILLVTIVPQIASAMSDIARQIPAFDESLMEMLGDLQRQYPELTKQMDILGQLEENWDNIVNGILSFLKNGLWSMLNSTIGIASSIVSRVASALIAFIFGIYLLAQKEKLGNQMERVCRAFLPQKVNHTLHKVCTLLNRNFTNFITGQCMEACILGTIFVAAMLIFQMPYAVMIGVLIAFTALIPIVGAFVGCIVGTFLILIVDPVKAVWFVGMFLIIQQIEGNLIYPRVVGSSVGLPAIWVLVAVSIGGSLFGVVGMLVFIPLVSTIYMLLREEVNRRNAVVVRTENKL